VVADDLDRQVRLAAFSFLATQAPLHGDVLPRTLLETGFVFNGERVPLMGPQGIFKPALIPSGMPLSVTTVATVEGKARPYEDEVSDDGMVRYRYRGTDPNHHENVGLRRAMATITPLIYFHGLVPGRYLAQWPVFIVGDDPSTLSFTVAMDDPQAIRPDLPDIVADDARRRYITRLARQLIHQAAFRQRVLSAYRTTCAMCRLRHEALLDAAHILPDTHPLGEPVVPNGLALCKLHHAAFDADIAGIRPDLIVEIRHDVLDEVDGPMLRHGLQGLHGVRLLVPRASIHRPKTEFLEERYEQFRAAG
jgi:putative restriction endonuclease